MGMFGFQESVYHGVPLVGIPIFSDQGDNAKRLIEKELGLEISDKKSFKARELRDKVETVIYDTRYVGDENKTKVQKCRVGWRNISWV